MNFADRLDAAVESVANPCLVGIDPHLDLLPEPFAAARDEATPRAERARLVEDFSKQLLDLVAGRVAAVKPQSAFFEVLGSDGVAAFERVVAHAHSLGLIVIGDVKRGDIASTAAAYARAFLGKEPAHCDAITVNPYLGPDTLDPFLLRCQEEDAGLYVLLRTSNPESHVVQCHGDPPLWTEIANEIEMRGTYMRGACGFSSIGAVVGATHPEELATLRAAMPHTPFLLPGYGAQGAGAESITAAFNDSRHPWRGGLINSSRGIAFAWRKHPGVDWKNASSRALDAMIADVGAALSVTSA